MDATEFSPECQCFDSNQASTAARNSLQIHEVTSLILGIAPSTQPIR